MLSHLQSLLETTIKRVFLLSVYERFLISLSTSQDTCVIFQQICRPSQTPDLNLPMQLHFVHALTPWVQKLRQQWYFNVENLPPILHLSSRRTDPDQSQAQQGLLSPLIIPSPLPWLWVRQIVDRDSGNLINPFMRVTNQMTRHLATLRESQLLPPFTRACINFIILTFRALGRNHIAQSLATVITMLCFN